MAGRKSDKRNEAARPAESGSTTWVGLHQLDKWKRDAASPEYAAAAFKILNSAGKISRQKYLEAMLDMDLKFPGHGWGSQVDELAKFYNLNQLELQKLPRVYAFTGDYIINKIPREPGQEG
jgi:hypothetical protein